MSAARKLQLVSVDDYLAGELTSLVKREYLGGVVYAMAGARLGHVSIAGNVHSYLLVRLRGRPCRPFNSDLKIRVRSLDQWRFYYPDVSVICRPTFPDELFRDDPVVLFEVLSQATRRIDMGEKKDAYLTIPTLSVYVMLEQDRAAAVVYRRTETGFVREVYEGLDAVIPLAEIGVVLPLAEAYETVNFSPETKVEDS